MENIKDPVGMSGHRLEARVHLVTVTTSAATNLINCAEELGLIVKGLVFQDYQQVWPPLTVTNKIWHCCC